MLSHVADAKDVTAKRDVNTVTPSLLAGHITHSAVVVGDELPMIEEYSRRAGLQLAVQLPLDQILIESLHQK